ncbi:hypothetical protein ABLB69_19560 [Xenorhabdus khoisanae]|uniref:hypothetical protein n=1 Tax=Xenorhabdus khoisanae TaxID=880157 RepID=UPI0032B87E3D
MSGVDALQPQQRRVKSSQPISRHVKGDGNPLHLLLHQSTFAFPPKDRAIL